MLFELDQENEVKLDIRCDENIPPLRLTDILAFSESDDLVTVKNTEDYKDFLKKKDAGIFSSRSKFDSKVLNIANTTPSRKEVVTTGRKSNEMLGRNSSLELIGEETNSNGLQ